VASTPGTSHGLGFGHGSLIEYPDGTVEYRRTGTIMPPLPSPCRLFSSLNVAWRCQVAERVLRSATPPSSRRLSI